MTFILKHFKVVDDGEGEEEVRKDEEGQLSVLISLRTRGAITVLLLQTLRLTLLSRPLGLGHHLPPSLSEAGTTGGAAV